MSDDRNASTTVLASLPAWPAAWTQPQAARSIDRSASQVATLAKLPVARPLAPPLPTSPLADLDSDDLSALRHDIERFTTVGSTGQQGLLATLALIESALFPPQGENQRRIHWSAVPKLETDFAEILEHVDRLEVLCDALVFPDLIADFRAEKAKAKL